MKEPFPFVGAGDATYFEWAEVHVRFARAPSTSQKRAIAATVPAPIDGLSWKGRDLRAGSDQLAHVRIAKTYGNRDVPIPDDDDGGGRFFFAKTREVDAFNADVERWLQAAHAICPIVVAFRHEDGESGGTRLSAWHKASVKLVPSLLANEFGDARDDDRGAYVARGLIAYALSARAKIPAAWMAFFDPSRDLVDALTKGDPKAFAKAVGKKPSKKTADAIAGALGYQPWRDAKKMRALLGAFDALFPVVKNDAMGLPSTLLLAALFAGDTKRVDVAKKAAHPDQLAYIGHALAFATKPRWNESIALFDIAIDSKKAALTTYNNALYVILRDNNGLRVDEKRNRRFLARCVPHAKKNPSIFYNAACVYAEMGDVDDALAHLALALRHGYRDLKQMKRDRVFKTAGLTRDPRFVALFARDDDKKKAPAKRASSAPSKRTRARIRSRSRARTRAASA